jgi:hypothetical protein
MRVADLLGSYRERVSQAVELDPLRLRLSRYIADLLAIEWPEGEQPVPEHTLVLATVRTMPQLDDDLRALEDRLRHASAETVVLACFEGAFESIPLPALTDVCDRAGWRIERLATLTATRIRTGVLMTVERRAHADAAGELSLHNALVLADHENRRLRRHLDDVLREGPRAIPVADPAPSTRAAVWTENDRLQDLTRQLETLRNQREDAERRWRSATDELGRVRGSAALLVGNALVKGRRQPRLLLRLPAELVRLVRRRKAQQGPARRATPSASPSVTPAGSTSPAPPAAARSDVPVRHPGGVTRMRIATIARRSLVERLRAAADVLPLVAGGWLGPARSQLAAVDMLLVDASAGSVSGAWQGLGEPGEVERTTELIRLLETASAMGAPSVLLVRDGEMPAGLRAVQDRFSAILPWQLGRDGWDPGVPLDQLPWPVDDERDHRPVYVTDGARAADLDLASGWLAALRPRELARWLVGMEMIVEPDLGGGLPTVRYPSVPFHALARRSVAVVPSMSDAFLVPAALAVGCRVLARMAIAGWEAALTVVEHPGRAQSVLNHDLEPSSAARVMEVRRRLLEHGSTSERLVGLADLLNLSIADSLRRRIGVSVLAHVGERPAGEALARGVLGQVIRPRDVIIASDQPADAAWLNELRASGVRVVTRPGRATWSQLVVAARRDAIAVWREGAEIGANELADLELAHVAPDRLAPDYSGGVLRVAYSSAASCEQPAASGLPEGMGVMPG